MTNQHQSGPSAQKLPATAALDNLNSAMMRKVQSSVNMSDWSRASSFRSTQPRDAVSEPFSTSDMFNSLNENIQTSPLDFPVIKWSPYMGGEPNQARQQPVALAHHSAPSKLWGHANKILRHHAG
ncbi:expressed unknown protein [Seminavis robusta]|uniref:Uncharacterized protein n=1 Tax=Seminavis robusta TaxID=568900 RepID=A0A9N8HVY2_9STRA|nr:expressed unknown protein [Seminavis robusta]|eukprot:Sro2027_g311700.1 n/a (125) ;mRNA; f:5628-6002